MCFAHISSGPPRVIYVTALTTWLARIMCAGNLRENDTLGPGWESLGLLGTAPDVAFCVGGTI